MKSLHWIATALAAPLFLAGQAVADYHYVTAVTPNPASFASSTVNFAPGEGTLPGSHGINIAGISLTGPATDTGSVKITDTISITDGGGMNTITVVGTLSFNGAQPTTFTLDTAASNLSTTIGTTTYAISSSASLFQISTPTPGGTPGSLSAFLGVTTSGTPVPEPASMALFGVGGLLLAAPRLRRLVRRIGRSQLG